jgi:hypothetical protein
MRLDPKVEGHAAQDQPHQHERHRQVQRRQHHAVGLREGHQQNADAQHQPGFVGVPERPNGRNHAVLVPVIHQRQQQANAKVETVQHHVGQHGDAHQRHEDQRQHRVHHATSAACCALRAM